ncbi:MAG TPA: histidinol phosphate phosphatase [Elusimicrobia bacterium]|jgi:glycosyltransferase involved in cell wall biosynthesis|nr:histidinol phosphate phosphatase [Elusimicrobiota bacterium]
MRVSLVIFSLNEIDGMRVIMPQIKKEWIDEIIIVDGGSTDGTIEYAKENGYFIFIQKEKGTGAAFMEAMEKVTGDVFIVFSPDGNSVPEKIPKLTEKLKEGYDMVVCSRYLNGAKSYDDDPITSFGNRMFTGLINLLFGSHITDALVMYRIYKKSIMKELGINTKSPSFGTHILLRALKKKLKIGEIPGDEPKRIGGVRKMQPLKNGLLELEMVLKEFFIR